MLQRFPRHFQELAMLRVKDRGFLRRKPEELGIKAVKAIKRRRTCSDAGPRFTKSPNTYKLSRLGEKSTSSSNRPKGASQP